MKKGKMKSDAELAAYWDTQSAAEIWDELEFDSGVRFDEDLRVVRSIRLKPSEVKAIELVAKHRGTSSSSVIRGYLRDGLRNESAARAGTRKKSSAKMVA